LIGGMNSLAFIGTALIHSDRAVSPFHRPPWHRAGTAAAALPLLELAFLPDLIDGLIDWSKRAVERLRVQQTVAQILAEPAEAAVPSCICAPPAPAPPRCNTHFDQLTFRRAIVHVSRSQSGANARQ
jgi:hypothetical protein